jgi:hypothetical protein
MKEIDTQKSECGGLQYRNSSTVCPQREIWGNKMEEGDCILIWVKVIG